MKPETLHERRCLEILHSESVAEFSKLLGRFTNSVGFDSFGTTVITDHSSGMTEFQSLTNASSAYLEDFQDLASAKFDPVSQHCKRSSLPIIWDQRFYVAADRGDFWEHQAAFGLKTGISIAWHLPHGRHFLFGVSLDQENCGNERRTRELASELSILGSYAQAAAFDICIPYERSTDNLKIAKSELDVLRWGLDGLCNWEIGRTMGISETEVALRFHRVIAKLGCANRYEACLRAIRLGLVHCD